LTRIALQQGAGVDPPLKSSSFRFLLAAQACAILVFAAIGGLWQGWQGAVSGALGAAIHLVGNFMYALMGGIVRPTTAPGALFLILRAEGFKVGSILVLLLGVLVFYRDLAGGPFILAFIAGALMFGLAFRRERP
jgi:F0F1-type ATP synthase assembly protein I